MKKYLSVDIYASVCIEVLWVEIDKTKLCQISVEYNEKTILNK